MALRPIVVSPGKAWWLLQTGGAGSEFSDLTHARTVDSEYSPSACPMKGWGGKQVLSVQATNSLQIAFQSGYTLFYWNLFFPVLYGCIFQILYKSLLNVVCNPGFMITNSFGLMLIL